MAAHTLAKERRDSGSNRITGLRKLRLQLRDQQRQTRTYGFTDIQIVRYLKTLKFVEGSRGISIWVFKVFSLFPL